MALVIVWKYVQRYPFAKASFTCNFEQKMSFWHGYVLTWCYFQEFVLSRQLGEEVMLIHGGSGWCTEETPLRSREKK